jgi:hypothetical protein
MVFVLDFTGSSLVQSFTDRLPVLMLTSFFSASLEMCGKDETTIITAFADNDGASSSSFFTIEPPRKLPCIRLVSKAQGSKKTRAALAPRAKTLLWL